MDSQANQLFEPFPLLDGKAILWPANEIAVFNEIFGENIYMLHPGVIAAVKSQDSCRLLDIGAHCGGFATYVSLALKKNGYHGPIWARCYEPQPMLYEQLRSNVLAHGIDADTHNLPVTGRVKSYYETRVRGNFFAGGSTVTTQHGSKRSDSSADAWWGIEEDVDVLKVDTEGWEVEILHGMADNLHRCRSVMVEHHTEYDRRMIDSLLVDFHLYRSSSCGQATGTSNYVRRDLL